MKLRNSIVLVHRWLALAAGVFWGIVALTGGFLVFERELDRMLNVGRFAVTEGELPPGALDRALAENFPGETVSSLAWLREDRVLRTTMQSGTGARRVFVDLGSGREVAEMRPRREAVGMIRQVHTSLFAGRPGGWLVTLASAAAVLSMITGLYLWWPGIRRFLYGFAVRVKRGAYILNFDLHQVLGAVTFVLLFIMTGTGVLMGVPGAVSGVARVVLPADPPPAARAAEAPRPRATASPPGVEELAAIAEEVVGGRVASMAFLEGDVGRVEVRVEPDGAADLARVTLARADGRILDVYDESTWTRTERFGNLVGQWHTGGFPSLFVRILFSAVSFIGAIIAGTGFVIWWVKRSRKLESASRRTTPATA